MASLKQVVEQAVAERRFSGVVRVDRGGSSLLAEAYGYADRAHQIPNTLETVFGTASGTKGLTALVVMRLVASGALSLDTTARSIVGDDLPMLDREVTIEHLLGHRSGIGDYLDEGADIEVTDYVMPIPVHELATTEDYLPLLADRAMAFGPGERFAYNNAGYVVLALITERVTGQDFPALVESLVCRPAGMVDTSFLRSDQLPGRAATGYLYAEGLQTNVLHLPVRGTGDGGAYSTAADFHAFWQALFEGQIVDLDQLAAMVEPISDWPEESRRYGRGFHLDATGDSVWLEGYDAGVSFFTLHQPSSEITYTVISNWSDGAWPVAAAISQFLGT